MTSRLLASCLIAFFTSGCGGKITGSVSTVPGGDGASGMLSLFSIAASMAVSTSQTALIEPSPKNYFYDLMSNLFPFAKAAVTVCTDSALNDACTGSNKQAVYTNCDISGTGYKFNGTVNLQFTSGTCAFSAASDAITRTTQITRTVERNEVVTTSSTNYTDQYGTTSGGGTKITKTAGGYDLSVLGLRKYVANDQGSIIRNISMRTTTDISMTNPASATVTFSGGVLEIVDNINLYKATYVPTSLAITYGTCCYPSSGSVAVNYVTGGLTGTATITFGGTCGTAYLTQGSATSQIRLLGCM